MRRKGFSLVEMIVCTVILAVVTVGMASVSGQITSMKTRSREDVLVGAHNLNTMERVRQMMRDGELSLEGSTYLKGGEFSTTQFSTEVYAEPTKLDSYNVVAVRIESTLNGSSRKIASTCVLTDIGGKRASTNGPSGDDTIEG